MQIKVTDLFKMHGVTRGYCTCGREVQQDKDKECPACGAELIWNIGEEKHER